MLNSNMRESRSFCFPSLCPARFFFSAVSSLSHVTSLGVLQCAGKKLRLLPGPWLGWLLVIAQARTTSVVPSTVLAKWRPPPRPPYREERLLSC